MFFLMKNFDDFCDQLLKKFGLSRINEFGGFYMKNKYFNVA